MTIIQYPFQEQNVFIVYLFVQSRTQSCLPFLVTGVVLHVLMQSHRILVNNLDKRSKLQIMKLLVLYQLYCGEELLNGCLQKIPSLFQQLLLCELRNTDNVFGICLVLQFGFGIYHFCKDDLLRAFSD